MLTDTRSWVEFIHFESFCARLSVFNCEVVVVALWVSAF